MADLTKQVAAKVAEMVPHLERTGGHLELVDVKDGIAQVKVWLTRPGTSRLVTTLQLVSGIERSLREAIPDLRGVEAINLPPHVLAGWDVPA